MEVETCDICFAVIIRDRIQDHRDWHKANDGTNLDSKVLVLYE